jgi:FkbM family methyltransferase
MNTHPAEDELVWQFFHRRTTGFFIDVGANEPTAGSQTWLLEKNGWNGILIEPLPHLAERLRGERSRSRVYQVACGSPGHPKTAEFHEAAAHDHSGLAKYAVDASDKYVQVHRVQMLTLDEVIELAKCPTIDFVSIDVEGAEFDVLRGFDLSRHKPSLVLLEDHLFNVNSHRLLRASGYRLVRRTGLNSWYIPRHTPFRVTLVDRLKLFRKVWLGTPLRAWKHRREVTRVLRVEPTQQR